ncbi:COMM domain-containing protein 1-like [Oscarella lobularis]|uniref:COMM domain-containing protein 1-like n=1 Tax=Oscarella lobularis TaxID=121494 RepID=UPI0033143E0A
MDRPEIVVGLLNGLSKKLFYGERLDLETIKEQLGLEIPDEDFSSQARRLSSVLANIASANMDFDQLEAFLTSQTKKKEGALESNFVAPLKKFWKQNRSKIHDALVKGSTWDNRLKGFSWRIDVKSKAKHLVDINQATAIVELELEQGHSSSTREVLRFEMDDRQLENVMKEIDSIDKQIANYSQ